MRDAHQVLVVMETPVIDVNKRTLVGMGREEWGRGRGRVKRGEGGVRERMWGRGRGRE